MAQPPKKQTAHKAVKRVKPVTKPAKAVAEPEPKRTLSERVRGIAWRSKHTWQQWGRQVARVFVRSSGPEVLLIATLAMARYLKNSDFSYPSEIILNIVLLGVLVSGAYYAFRLVLRRPLPAHIAGLLFAYACYGFSYAFPTLRHIGEKLIPNSATPFTHALLMLLFLAIAFGLLGYAVDTVVRANKQLRTVPILKFIVFLVCFVFATEVGKVGLRMWTIRHDLAYKQPDQSLQQDTSKITAKPNVYYLEFDRYASASTLKNIYGYDNTDLMNFLGEQGFVNREDAYANYPFTMQSISSTLGMDYHAAIGKQFKNDAVGFQTAFPYRSIISNPPIAQALKANGYQYTQVSSWWDFTRNVPTADTEPTESFRLRLFGKNFWVTDLQRDIINKSALSPLLLKGLTIGHTTIAQYQLDRNPTQNFYAQINAIKAIAEQSSKTTQPRFTFAHVLSPHDPYIFDADGNTPDYDSNRTDNDEDELVKYTNQVTYINTQIKDVVATIRAKDPKAVVIIQADEGPYPKQFRGTLTADHYYDPIDLAVPQMQQKFGVLASYYLPDTAPEAVQQNIDSSVNAFRYVLSRYLGYNVPKLPDCQFSAGDKFYLYNYQLVSGKLKNTAEPAACKQYK